MTPDQLAARAREIVVRDRDKAPKAVYAEQQLELVRLAGKSRSLLGSAYDIAKAASDGGDDWATLAAVILDHAASSSLATED